jgi:diacylglycerol kinase family enzyme
MRRLSDDSNRVIILANPTAGPGSKGKAIDRLDASLREHGFRVNITTDPNQMADEVACALETGELRTVVAAGGDGTAKLVVNRTPAEVAVTLLPLGTENLLSKYLKLSGNPDAVFQAIRQGHTVRLDAGRVGDRLFLLMLGCGFDADVVHRLHRSRRGHIQHISYARPILESVLSYRYPELRVSYRDGPTDDWIVPGDRTVHWAFIFNLPSYASGLAIAPQADGQDGRLDVCTFQGPSFWRGLIHLGAIMLRRHREWGNCVTTRATAVRIESDTEVPYQMDGDPGGTLPVEIEVLPRRARFVVPAGAAEHLGD